MGSLISWNCQQFKRITLPILIYGSFFFNGIIKAEGDPAPINSVSTVVIDAGHGGHDPGAIGIRAKEKDIVLRIALQVGKYIQDNLSDVKVIYTRDKDVFIPLFERADIANRNKADLFISIHANANLKKYIYGSETYVM
jgi:N-acetylmuramoyl-L-alanine amidase